MAPETVWTNDPLAIKVNGQTVGSIQPNGNTLGSVARQYARQYGLRAYTVLLDGQPVDTAQASQTLAGHQTLELVAKDARGTGRSWMSYAMEAMVRRMLRPIG